MGARLSTLVKARKIKLSTLSGTTVAFDANNLLYQFLALVRMPDGTLFKDTHGRITSHLLGAALRITRLMMDYNIKPVMVFDGTPNVLKTKTLEGRKKQRTKALMEWKEEIEKGNLRKAFSKAVVSATLGKDLVGDAVTMFKLMGVPIVFAPEDAEAQASYMCIKNDVWTVATQDYDALLYGAPRVVRYVTIHGTEFLPSKMMSKPLVPEIVSLEETLRLLKLSREQLIDIAILSGTDFNDGVPMIGPKKAYILIKKYGCIEKIPDNKVIEEIGNFEEIRKIFLQPKIVSEYSIAFKRPETDKIIEFFRQRDFSEKNIEKIIERLNKFYNSIDKPTLKKWF